MNLKTLDTKCNDLTKAVKSHLADQSVEFIHAFSAEKIQNPPQKYIVSVVVEDIQESGFVADSGGIVEATLTYRVYAPRDTNDEELCRLCTELAQAIGIEGKELVDTVRTAKPSYDTKARCIYREISVGISYLKEVIR